MFHESHTMLFVSLPLCISRRNCCRDRDFYPKYHVTLFIQFRNDHYHVILTAVYRLSQASSNKSAPVMMLVKVFTLLLSFSYVISDGQVRQVSFNLLNIEHVRVECHYYHDHDYEETFYYFYHKNQVNELICENYCRFP